MAVDEKRAKAGCLPLQALRIMPARDYFLGRGPLHGNEKCVYVHLNG